MSISEAVYQVLRLAGADGEHYLCDLPPTLTTAFHFARAKRYIYAVEWKHRARGLTARFYLESAGAAAMYEYEMAHTPGSAAPAAVIVSANAASKWRKAGKGDGRKLTKQAAQEQVRGWIKQQPGGKWRGTLKELRAALADRKAGIGLDRSEGRLSDYLRGTSLIDKARDTSRIARRHRKGGAEPVAQTEAWTMPAE